MSTSRPEQCTLIATEQRDFGDCALPQRYGHAAGFNITVPTRERIITVTDLRNVYIPRTAVVAAKILSSRILPDENLPNILD